MHIAFIHLPEEKYLFLGINEGQKVGINEGQKDGLSPYVCTLILVRKTSFC